MSIDEKGRLDRIDYGDRVYFDSVTGIAGTTYPIGTAGMPSDVVANAVAICVLRNIDIIHVTGTLAIGAGIAQTLTGHYAILTVQTAGAAYVRDFSGYLEIDEMTGGTIDIVMSGGTVTINADCTAGTINIYGSATITNNAIGAVVNDYTEQDDRDEQTVELITADMALVTAFGSGALAGAGAEATLCSLDAVGGTKKDVKVTVYLDAAVAGNITERWYLTSIAAPAVFVLKLPENAAHAPGAACVLTREFGDLPEGLQLQFRIHSVGNDVGVNYEVALSYLE